MINSQHSGIVRKNVVDLPHGTQLEIPFGAQELPPPPPFVEDTWTDEEELSEIEIVDYPPINWRSWTLGFVGGGLLGYLLGNHELQAWLYRILTSNTK